MKQDESVLKTLENKTRQEIRQSPRLQKTKTKKSMKHDKSVFKTPKKKTTQEIRQSPRLKMIEYKKSVTPIKIDDSLVKNESDEKVTDMKIHLPNAKIDITPELVHDLLGIPLGGKDIYNTDQCEGKELMDWKQQYNFKAMRPSDVEERIKESSDSGIIFRINFLLLFVNTICEQNKPGTSYLEFMRNDKNEKRQIHALYFWDYEMMMKREKAKLKSADFGTLEWYDDVIENDEESDTDENEDMKLDTKRGYMLGRGMIETMQPRLWVHAHVIDAWTDILNYEENLKSNSTMNRYFFDTSMVIQFIFDKNIPFNERFDKFESNIKDAMKKDKELLTFEKVHLEPTVDVIDNRNSVAKFSRAYRDAPNELKILFSRYLIRVNHKSASTLEGVEPERVNMNWRTRDNHVECGVFCMRHMETYMGDKTVNWTCGLPKESKQQQSVLND
ncbi:unnamed protein product [Lactuca virosa]|uniref:Ubiquitin-like protease family profile domain-containing protein n=1 Tax=Lactuca virosa TaxID=75947 RepID=A0AAU9LFT8_9ASTR|nr:unnamed protein product [Lactuca virosa]